MLEALQAKLDASAQGAPKKRGRPRKHAQTVEDILHRAQPMPEPWYRLDEGAFDALRTPLPDIAIPRTIPADPSVFTQLGPLPHARIEASLCLAALMHRAAQWVQQQFEEGPQSMEEAPLDGEAPVAASPFDSPLPAPKPHKGWRYKKRKGKG